VRNRHVLIAAIGVISALIALGVIGVRVLARDRERGQGDFAQDKLEALDRAAHELGNDVGEIGEDLELAGALLERAGSPEIADRELHAVATIKREYLAVEARVPGHEPLRVVALDAPQDILDQVEATLDEAAAAARRQPETLITSGPLGPSGDAAWRRVFARTGAAPDAPVIALVVDMRPLLARLRLLRDTSSALLVLGAHGRAAPASDPQIARIAGDPDQLAHHPDIARLLAGVATRRPTTVTIRESEAAALGLASATAVGVAVPVEIEDGEPWALALVSSTVALRTQERTLVQRLILGGVIAATLVIGLAVYFLLNARRAAVLRERIRHTDRLAHLTEKAEKILDHIPSGVLALGEHGRVTATNRWFDERLGRGCVGEHLPEVFAAAPREEIAELEQLAAAALAGGQPRSLHRVPMTVFGAETYFNVHAVPMQRRLADVHALLVFEDLTPLRRVEERLLHSEKLVTAGQLAAGIAHEIGTPLNIARGRAELALGRVAADPVEAAGQRVIIEQIDLVSEQIHQLLDYVRPGPTRVQLVELEPALKRVIDLLGAQAAKRKAHLELDVAAATPAVRADPAQLQQVIVNLVLNAIDAVGDGGRIVLRAHPAAAGAVIEVVDDGAGIPADELARVFDPFFTTKKRGQGTGLGLWVVAQLVRAHGGEIHAHSERGAGTTFRLVWPATAEVAA